MEYEYSYKVSNLKEYIDYIEKYYTFKSSNKESRVIYRNDNNTNARITYINDEMYLDFKENKLSGDDLIERKESKSIKFDNLENCEDILHFLGYKKDNSMVRTRTIYEGENIKFEIDEYTEPIDAFVLSFEGEKSICDKVNDDFKELNNKYKI